MALDLEGAFRRDKQLLIMINFGDQIVPTSQYKKKLSIILIFDELHHILMPLKVKNMTKRLNQIIIDDHHSF